MAKKCYLLLRKINEMRSWLVVPFNRSYLELGISQRCYITRGKFVDLDEWFVKSYLSHESTTN